MELSVIDGQMALLMQRFCQSQDITVDHDGGGHHYSVFDDGHRRRSTAATARVEMSNHHRRENNNLSSFIKKRKAEYDANNDDEEEESPSQSAITTKNKSNSNSTDEKYSKVSQQKPDYIHVRARRGQATDSHSLAERARREKISKKMKCLQDLVPGYNRATGKAGMLDEIINYVQSLQNQVEFLSMKLAVVNPIIDVSVDDFLAKEIPAYIANLPSCDFLKEPSSSSLADAMHFPEGFFDPSLVHQLQQMSGLESEFHNLYNIGGDVSYNSKANFNSMLS